MRTIMRAAAVVGLFTSVLSAAQPTIKAEVDMRDIPRRLLHTRLEIPVKPGKVALWYPKWIPGVHAPGGPVENIGGLRFETPDGKPVAWKRDEIEMHRITADVPAGTTRLIARLDYICNQPNNNSGGVDSWGNGSLGIVNFNTVLLYPEGLDSEELQVAVSVVLPEGWKHGCALPVAAQKGGRVSFKPRSLVEVIDSPLIAGEHFRTIPLRPEGTKWPAVYLHTASESESAIRFDDKRIAQYVELVAEGEAMFGVAHFGEYHFLLICSDEIPRIGLEHHTSSLNAVGERDIVDERKFKDWAAYLLPHEFVHSWCGKYRRPGPMCCNDYHTPQRTSLLWVYEGLTQYLGEVLAVRAGMLTMDEYQQRLAAKISALARQDGRRWRSLEDTALASWTLRARSRSWSHLRRSQDYYNEGLLIWMEADAIIRQQTDGKRSLDNFCRLFFGRGDSAQRVAPYTLDDVVAALNEVAPYDWAKFFKSRVESPLESLSLEFVTRAGYRLSYDNATPKMQEAIEAADGTLDASDSLGLRFAKDGKVTAVIPGMPGDKAGLAPDATVIGVNGLKFSRQRMKDAIADSVTKRGIELLVLNGEKFRTIKLDYADGLRYMTLTHDASKPDLLGAILKPSQAGGATAAK